MSNDPQPQPRSEPTLADLKAKQDRLRAERRAQTARTATDDPGSMSSQSIRCNGCDREFSVPVFQIGGRPILASPGRICPDCVERRQAEAAAEAAEAERTRMEEQREWRRSQIKHLLHRAGVNAWDHGDATLENFDTSSSGASPLDAVRLFLAEARAAEKFDPVRGLYLFGGTGAGKSHLAAAVARELLLDPAYPPDSIVFDHALRLIGSIQRTYSTPESADSVLDRRINARVWILDDLGTEAPSADVVRRLTEIFTERAMRPTLVTSNLAPDKLEGRHSEFYRVVSRLGPRYFRTVQVRGSDRRFSAPEAA